MVLGIHLLFALLAGVVYWLVGLLLSGRINGALVTILAFAAGTYAFWWLNTLGPIQIGR